MGDAFIVRRGGDGFKWDSAIIHVYAPAGSAVTATKGSTTKTLKEHTVSGDDSEYIMVVKNADFGTWTITASLSGKTAIRTVVVADNIEYSVSIGYLLELYNAGNEYTDQTGGWDFSLGAGGIGQKYSTYIELSYSGAEGRDAAVATHNQIRRGTYSNLYADVNITDANVWFGMSTNKGYNTSFMASVHDQSTGRKTLSVDLTALASSDEGYIKFYADVATVQIYHVWME